MFRGFISQWMIWVLHSFWKCISLITTPKVSEETLLMYSCTRSRLNWSISSAWYLLEAMGGCFKLCVWIMCHSSSSQYAWNKLETDQFLSVSKDRIHSYMSRTVWLVSVTIAKVPIKTSMLAGLSIMKWKLLQGKGVYVMLEASLELADPVNFGELVSRLDNEEEIDHSYTNWLGAGVVPWWVHDRTKPISIVKLKCMTYRPSPLILAQCGRHTDVPPRWKSRPVTYS